MSTTAIDTLPAADEIERLEQSEEEIGNETPHQPVPPVPLPSLSELSSPLWTPGVLHVLGPVEVPGFLPRRVRVYLPSTARPGIPHPVVYGFDGQNLFGDDTAYAGGWHFHRVIERRAARKRVAPIVVGIDHGERERIDELSPFAFEHSKGRADAFLDWVTGAVLPRLEAELPILPFPEARVIGGSSMGGLAALYAHLRHPQLFGNAMVMSPSFWVADAAMLDHLAAREESESGRVYLDAGRHEGNGTLTPVVQQAARHLREIGYTGDRLRVRIEMRGGHDEKSWNRRLPGALRFFLGA